MGISVQEFRRIYHFLKKFELLFFLKDLPAKNIFTPWEPFGNRVEIDVLFEAN